MSKHTLYDLQELQALPLYLKIRLTKQRIREWVSHYGEDGVYVSFSGGKDSTVLLHIVRQEYPDVPAVFVDTGLEFPEIREFVRTFNNVEWIKPKKNFRQVIQDYGYPFISKEVSEYVYGSRKYLTKIISEKTLVTDRQTDRQTWASLSNEQKKSLLDEILRQSDRKKIGKDCIPWRFAAVVGVLSKDNCVQLNLRDKKNTEENKSMYCCQRYQYMLDAPFEISHMCCNVMKKTPIHHYCEKTGRVGMTGQMASESRLRTQQWLQNGCNGFELKTPISNPMSFWTEQDVLAYICENNIQIASVYGNVVMDDGDNLEGQMHFVDYGIFEYGVPVLKTTGCKRTGCVFCGFGCHREKPGEGRFERLKETHPKLYNYVFKSWDEGGLGYKEVIDWLNKNGDLHINY